jgi:hypothetical protein
MTLDSFAGLSPAQSPLFMAVNDPVLHRFISFLAGKKSQQERSPGESLTIDISRDAVTRLRESFKQSILDGEWTLHMMAHVLSTRFLGKECELHSNAIGVLPGGEQRPFLIRERITRDILFSQTDLDLGNQMLAHFRYRADGSWLPLELSANFVEYLPPTMTSAGVNRITSRVKAEEELWNKVADELFGLDELVQRDKHLRQYSKYIKDIFGLKIVCENDEACLAIHEQLRALRVRDCDWSLLDDALRRRSASFTFDADAPLLEFVETKDYLSCAPSERKRTGWKALKSVVRWQGQLLEIQVQPVANYYMELDHMAGPSHRSFKISRDAFREELARRIPLYGFYRNLLKRLFVGNGGSFESKSISVVLTD